MADNVNKIQDFCQVNDFDSVYEWQNPLEMLVM